MLSRLLSSPSRLNHAKDACHSHLNLVSRRWSGHNTMEIKPDNYEWRYVKNWFHFYILATGIPLGLVTMYLHIRANPELQEVPEDYEPRHWEYYRFPLSRFMAKYLYHPMELEYETNLGYLEYFSEAKILKKIAQRAEKVMSFYNDHRSLFFTPYYADHIRVGRDELGVIVGLNYSLPSEAYDDAFEPGRTIVPIEGFKDGPVPP